MPAIHGMKRSAWALAALMGGTAAAASEPAPSPGPLALAEVGFALKLPKAEGVVYRGMVNYDSAGNGAQTMMYPAPGLAGFLVAVATHGVLVESSKNSQKTRLQEAADEVLNPYKTGLAGFSNRELMDQGIAKLSIAGPKKLIEPADTAEAWVVESLPAFALTQDRAALVLENTIVVYRADSPSTIRYQNVVKVVSDPRNTTEAPGPWGEDAVKLLKEESVALFAHSLKLAIEDLARAASTQAEVHKTFRYPEGTERKIERAQFLSDTCDRTVVKTLRGWLMSIPLQRPADRTATDACKTADRYPA